MEEKEIKKLSDEANEKVAGVILPNSNLTEGIPYGVF